MKFVNIIFGIYNWLKSGIMLVLALIVAVAFVEYARFLVNKYLRK
jgi:hypothetical protein